jgi:adenylate cyclase
MMRPFKNGMLNQACPMAEIFAELSTQLNELQVLKAQQNNNNNNNNNNTTS